MSELTLSSCRAPAAPCNCGHCLAESRIRNTAAHNVGVSSTAPPPPSRGSSLFLAEVPGQGCAVPIGVQQYSQLAGLQPRLASYWSSRGLPRSGVKAVAWSGSARMTQSSASPRQADVVSPISGLRAGAPPGAQPYPSPPLLLPGADLEQFGQPQAASVQVSASPSLACHVRGVGFRCSAEADRPDVSEHWLSMIVQA